VKERREGVRKSSRLMGISKIVPSKETPEETGSIAKRGAKAQAGKDVKRESLPIGSHLDDGIQS
jgi:hypothetical protein